MKKLSIIFVLLTSSLFGQDNPMFDSLDYFKRNNIKTIHYYISDWYYSPGWNYLEFSFDKKTNTLSCDSIRYDDPTSQMSKVKAFGTRGFSLRDTIYHQPGFTYFNTINYRFDTKGRLIKMLDITKYYDSVAVDGLSPSNKTFTTTTEYSYADSNSKKLTRTTTDYHSFIEVRNFLYDKNRLVKRIDILTQKSDNKVSVETNLYEYYADGKLRKETRQVKDSRCKTNCEGTIEYKYEPD